MLLSAVAQRRWLQPESAAAAAVIETGGRSGDAPFEEDVFTRPEEEDLTLKVY